MRIVYGLLYNIIRVMVIITSFYHLDTKTNVVRRGLKLKMLSIFNFINFVDARVVGIDTHIQNFKYNNILISSLLDPI